MYVARSTPSPMWDSFKEKFRPTPAAVTLLMRST